jgi:uncharacterized protein YbjT (DUF2867 family)
LKQGKAVRAMVRTEDERAQALREKGAEVVVGDLLDLDSMHKAIGGCETMYFGMSVSDTYLAATVNVAAVAKHHGVKAFINMSQMTLAQMSITETTPSPQHKLHWLAEQALNWSGLPVGYGVTVIKDATADYSNEEMHAALDINIPNYANAVVTTKEIVDAISA